MKNRTNKSKTIGQSLNEIMEITAELDRLLLDPTTGHESIQAEQEAIAADIMMHLQIIKAMMDKLDRDYPSPPTDDVDVEDTGTI